MCAFDIYVNMCAVNTNALKISLDQDAYDFVFRIKMTFNIRMLIPCIKIHTSYIESCISILVSYKRFWNLSLLCFSYIHVFCRKKIKLKHEPYIPLKVTFVLLIKLGLSNSLNLSVDKYKYK